MILSLPSEVTMKQKLFVLGSNPHHVDDVRRRFGDTYDVVICQSSVEIQHNLEHYTNAVVLPLAANGNGGTIRNVDELIENIVSLENGEKSMPKTLADRVDLLEQKIIESTLTRNRHHRKDTAAELGISRVTLYNKMKKFGMLN